MSPLYRPYRIRVSDMKRYPRFSPRYAEFGKLPGLTRLRFNRKTLFKHACRVVIIE